MNKKTYKLLVIIFCAVIFFGGAALLYNRFSDRLGSPQLAVPTDAPQGEGSPSGTSEPEKQLAPDFTVYDADGAEVHLSDFIGKPVVLNFWASWCGPCKMEMPHFDQAYQELGDQVHFLMVNATSGRETQESAEAFLEKEGYSFPVYFDLDSDALMNYGIFSFPTTFFIDAEGYIVTGARGAISAEQLQVGLDLIIQ